MIAVVRDGNTVVSCLCHLHCFGHLVLGSRSCIPTDIWYFITKGLVDWSIAIVWYSPSLSIKLLKGSLCGHQMTFCLALCWDAHPSRLHLHAYTERTQKWLDGHGFASLYTSDAHRAQTCQGYRRLQGRLITLVDRDNLLVYNQVWRAIKWIWSLI